MDSCFCLCLLTALPSIVSSCIFSLRQAIAIRISTRVLPHNANEQIVKCPASANMAAVPLLITLSIRVLCGPFDGGRRLWLEGVAEGERFSAPPAMHAECACSKSKFHRWHGHAAPLAEFSAVCLQSHMRQAASRSAS